MFDRLKRSLARSRHQDHVNDALKNLQKALPGMDFEKVVDVTSNSHLEAWLEGLSDRTAVGLIKVPREERCLAHLSLLSRTLLTKGRENSTHRQRAPDPKPRPQASLRRPTGQVPHKRCAPSKRKKGDGGVFGRHEQGDEGCGGVFRDCGVRRDGADWWVEEV